MESINSQPAWAMLSLLHHRFDDNVNALSKRYPQMAAALRNCTPKQTYFVRPIGNQIQLGVGSPDSVTPLPHPLQRPPPILSSHSFILRGTASTLC